MVPVFLARGELRPCLLIGMVTELKDLMDKKCKQIQDKKVYRKMLLALPVVVLDIVALVFEEEANILESKKISW